MKSLEERFAKVQEVSAMRETAATFLARAICSAGSQVVASRYLRAQMTALPADHPDMSAYQHAMDVLWEQNIRERLRE